VILARLPIDLGPGIRAAFTTTTTGNLGLTLGDDPAAVVRRRRTLDEWLGAPATYVRQVHGADVHVCAGGPRAAGAAPPDAADALVPADALVATDGTALAVLVADCVPVLLADPVHRVIGAVHAGRRGVVAGVVRAAVTAMEEVGARRADLRAVVGPAICGACYEVPAELRDEVEALVPGTAATTSWGTPSLDLPAGVLRQLREAGVGAHVLEACTLTDPRWFSHRGSGRQAGDGHPRPPGRFAAVVRVTPGVSRPPSRGPGLA